jgi:hypothetical protein
MLTMIAVGAAVGAGLIYGYRNPDQIGRVIGRAMTRLGPDRCAWWFRQGMRLRALLPAAPSGVVATVQRGLQLGRFAYRIVFAPVSWVERVAAGIYSQLSWTFLGRFGWQLAQGPRTVAAHVAHVAPEPFDPFSGF